MKHFTTLTFLFFAIVLHSQTYKWSSLPVGGAGFVTGIITCPQQQNLIFARTDVGGAFKWDESIKGWKCITDWVPETSTGYLGVESMAIDPREPNKVYMYCGTSYWNSGKSAILYSSDYGETWTERAIVTSTFPSHGNDNGRQSGEQLAVDPNKGIILFCGSRTKGLWRSLNAGLTWTRIANATFPDNVKVSFVQFVSSSGVNGAATPVIYVGLQRKGSTNLYSTADSGTTWTAVKNQPTTYMTHRCTYSNNKLYITYSDSEGPGSSNTGAVQKLNLADTTWTSISPITASFGEVTVDPTDPQKLMVTTQGMWLQQSWISGGSTTYGDQIYLSDNDGGTWRNLFPSNCTYSEPDVVWLKTSSQLHWAGSAKIDPYNRNRAFVISGNGIYMTENLWATKSAWRMALKGLEETVPMELVSVVGGPIVTSIGDYDGFVYNDLTKYYARHTPTMGSTDCISVAGKSPLKMVRVGGDTTNFMYYTENGGVSWTKVTKKPTVAPKKGWCANSADGSIFVWTPEGKLTFYSVNKGVSWVAMPGISAINVRFFADYETPNVFYAVVSGQLRTYTYDTNSLTFSYSSTTLSGNVNNRLTTVPGVSGEIWVPMNLSGLMRISDATSATPTKSAIAVYQATCVGVGKAAPAKTYPSLYIWGKPSSVSTLGIYRSDDEGVNWTRVNDNMHQFGGPGNAQFVKGDMNVYGRVFMSTVGRGIIMGDIDSTTGFSELNTENNLNSRGRIFENSLTIQSLSNARYAIIDLSGKIIEQKVFSGSAEIGTGLHSGMYILTIVEGNKKITYRIVKTER
jgi:hypothetical protein